MFDLATIPEEDITPMKIAGKKQSFDQDHVDNGGFTVPKKQLIGFNSNQYTKC